MSGIEGGFKRRLILILCFAFVFCRERIDYSPIERFDLAGSDSRLDPLVGAVNGTVQGARGRDSDGLGL